MKVSYDTFKRDYLPLPTDTHSPVEVIDDEQFASIQDYFKTLKGASAN